MKISRKWLKFSAVCFGLCALVILSLALIVDGEKERIISKSSLDGNEFYVSAKYSLGEGWIYYLLWSKNSGPWMHYWLGSKEADWKPVKLISNQSDTLRVVSKGEKIADLNLESGALLLFRHKALISHPTSISLSRDPFDDRSTMSHGATNWNEYWPGVIAEHR